MVRWCGHAHVLVSEAETFQTSLELEKTSGVTEQDVVINLVLAPKAQVENHVKRSFQEIRELFFQDEPFLRIKIGQMAKTLDTKGGVNNVLYPRGDQSNCKPGYQVPQVANQTLHVSLGLEKRPFLARY